MNDLVNAMKNKDKETLAVLRMLKGAIQLEEINNKHELTDSEFISVLSKQIKMRKESILEFTKAGREDLLNQTQNEIEILSKYMPEQLKEEEVVDYNNDIVLHHFKNYKTGYTITSIYDYVNDKDYEKID